MVLAIAAIVSCGGTPASSTTSASPTAVTTTATVAVANNGKLGMILVDRSGRTLYLFQADTGTSSTCYGSCATYSPPLLTEGAPKARDGPNASLLGTTKRTDGTTEGIDPVHPPP